MNCPHCTETTTQKRMKKTKLGYTTYFCQRCQRTFNERTGTPFNDLEFPTDIVLLAVIWRLCYKLSLRDVAEMFLERGFVFTHETLRDWEARFAPLIADQLRTKRRGQAGAFWYVDETYLKVHGKWCYLYRAVDCDRISPFIVGCSRPRVTTHKAIAKGEHSLCFEANLAHLGSLVALMCCVRSMPSR
jgi:DDE domain